MGGHIREALVAMGPERFPLIIREAVRLASRDDDALFILATRILVSGCLSRP
jgi:hypothetical protein